MHCLARREEKVSRCRLVSSSNTIPFNSFHRPVYLSFKTTRCPQQLQRVFQRVLQQSFPQHRGHHVVPANRTESPVKFTIDRAVKFESSASLETCLKFCLKSTSRRSSTTSQRDRPYDGLYTHWLLFVFHSAAG